ncbi:HD domain-containing protein [Hamadaea sp. NPDC051192]|uniref:HD domain-containing protein n=1 Tax=Hamadaea sp. NPDC051192 TaxID=3154940 RepID=UPI003442DDCB
MQNLVAWSIHVATRCLGSAGLEQRWRHVQAVGARAHQLRFAVADDEQDVLIAAAWLHDVGYAPTIAHTGLHSLDGARYLDTVGLPRRVTALVAHHTGARFEAARRGLVAELEAYEREDGPLADALATADLTVGPSGQSVSAQERIAEILTRYPPDSPVHQAVAEGRQLLLAAVGRVDARVCFSETSASVSAGGGPASVEGDGGGVESLDSAGRKRT